MKKALLIILDGFGISKKSTGNAVAEAKMPFFKKLLKNHPHTFLQTHGAASGLPENQTGASEPGHVVLGAGRRVWQPLEKINRDFLSGDILKNQKFKKFLKAIVKVKKIHLIGLLSDGGVHSHLSHLENILEILKSQQKIISKKILIHAIADGRDVAPRSIKKYLQNISNKKIGKIASLAGRFFAMDRDQNWDRTEKYFQLLTKKIGEKKSLENLDEKKIYQNAENDYFINPCFDEKNFLPIEKNDVVLFFNFRSDRAAQISTAFCDRNFTEFSDFKMSKDNFFIFGPFCQFATNIFPPEKIKNNLGEILEKNNKTQLRIAETEKFAHVTFFFNSQKKRKNRGEKRILVPSKKCRSFAEFPEMSAYEITEKLIFEIQNSNFDFIFCNFANADLVGHSGNFIAAKKACKTLDKVLSKILPIAQKNNYQILISADHGNADEMVDDHGEISMSHSKATAPLIFIGDQNLALQFKKNLKTRKSRGKMFGVDFFGELADIAPTILSILQIKKPAEMTGKSFLEN